MSSRALCVPFASSFTQRLRWRSSLCLTPRLVSPFDRARYSTTNVVTTQDVASVQACATTTSATSALPSWRTSLTLRATIIWRAPIHVNNPTMNSIMSDGANGECHRV